ncbi:MAG: 3-dehydroquinate synthase [Ignavibacteriaceae bacterium]|nr:3-dehydroquinate synthase [Ignavibacteriaceae bacterium]
MKMKVIKVLKGKNKYEVFSGIGTFNLLPDLVSQKGLYSNILFVVDQNVMKYHSDKIKSVREKFTGKNNIYIMPSGEKNKSNERYNRILTFLAENNYGRDSLIAAVGGGVTGDIAGFVASTYLRGVQLVQIPTTLLAAVDSSVGGKTGINFFNRKNIVGTFYQPDIVLTDTDFLKTLPKSEIISGTGEIIKYAFLSGREFYNEINDSYNSIISLDDKTLNKIIPGCIRIKAEIVTEDEQESGLRKILNLGHTFAHAYESYFNFRIKHGNAVAAGIISALYLSFKKGIINQTSLKYFLNLPLKIYPNKSLKPDGNEIFTRMLSDKKNKSGRIKFILLKDIGEVLIDVEADKDEVLYSIRKTFIPQSDF